MVSSRFTTQCHQFPGTKMVSWHQGPPCPCIFQWSLRLHTPGCCTPKFFHSWNFTRLRSFLIQRVFVLVSSCKFGNHRKNEKSNLLTIAGNCAQQNVDITDVRKTEHVTNTDAAQETILPGTTARTICLSIVLWPNGIINLVSANEGIRGGAEDRRPNTRPKFAPNSSYVFAWGLQDFVARPILLKYSLQKRDHDLQCNIAIIVFMT